jgi:ribose transport system substrate-binding protein
MVTRLVADKLFPIVQATPIKPMKPAHPLRHLLAVLACAAALAGCGKNPAAAGEKKLKLAFVTNTAATFWTIARAGCEDAGKTLGNVEVDFRIPSTGGAAEQQQILDDLLAKGVDGIAVSPIDPKNQTAFLDRIASQTLLICHDSDAPESKRVAYIGTDNFAAGVEAGKLLKEALPGGGKVMAFVGFTDAENASQRFGGIKKELEGSGIEILDIRTDDTDIVRAQKNAEDALVKHPDLAGMVGLYAYNGPAILNAVRAAGQAGKVKIVCFDENDETLEGVASGDIHGTVVQQPYEFGKQAITRMAKHLAGDTDALSGGKQIVPTRSLRKDDVAAFKADLAKILGK